MRVPMSCMRCVHAMEAAGEPDAYSRAIVMVPVTAGGVFEWTCKNGHTVAMWLSSPLYVLLYSEGISDLADNDTRSGVLNIYSAWENFVAQAVGTLLHSYGVSDDVPGSIRRAEPMIGMFAALFASKTVRFPDLVKPEATAIRNAVAHGDLIPTNEQAFKVADAVRGCINNAVNALGMGDLEHYRSPSQRERIENELREYEAAHPRASLAPFYYGSGELRIDVREAITGAKRRYGREA